MRPRCRRAEDEISAWKLAGLLASSATLLGRNSAATWRQPGFNRASTGLQPDFNRTSTGPQTELHSSQSITPSPPARAPELLPKPASGARSDPSRVSKGGASLTGIGAGLLLAGIGCGVGALTTAQTVEGNPLTLGQHDSYTQRGQALSGAAIGLDVVGGDWRWERRRVVYPASPAQRAAERPTSRGAGAFALLNPVHTQTHN